MTRCAVIGAGAGGTALADLLARNGHKVSIWAYEWDVVESINRSHQNRRFLAGHHLYDTLRAFNEIQDALDGAELVAFATPSHVLRAIARSSRAAIMAGCPVVIASKGGAPTSPDWFHNLVAHPDVTVEVGAERFPPRAIVTEGDERDRLFAAQAAKLPNFAEYQRKTTRRLPVVVLEPQR